MTAHYHYSRPTTPTGPGFDIDLGSSVVLVGVGEGGSVRASDAFTGLQTHAEVGNVGISSITFDDPVGSLASNAGGTDTTITGYRRFYMVEDSCPSNDTYVFNGYIGAREFHRGEDHGITPTGAARRIMAELQDDNAILGFRIARGSDASRPKETGGARLKWLLGSDYLSTVYDDGLVSYPCNQMDATDYRGQYARDILADVAVQTGYNFWAQYDQQATTPHIQLWFDRAASSNFASALRISNVTADIDNTTTFAALADPGNWPILRRDPSRAYAGVYLPYKGGAYYAVSSNTSYKFAMRDGAAPTANISTLATAKAAANRFLGDSSTENDIVTCSILLPPSKLTAIKAGHRMKVKFSHLPGYEQYTDVRVLKRTVIRPQPTDQRYQLKLELTPIPAPPCDPSLTQPPGFLAPLGGTGYTPNPTVDSMGPYYFRAGLGGQMPTIGYVGTFQFFPVFNFAYPGWSGSADMMSGNASNDIYLYVLGDQTLTIYLADGGLASAAFGNPLTPQTSYVTISQDDFSTIPITIASPGDIATATLVPTTSLPYAMTAFTVHVTSLKSASLTCYHVITIAPGSTVAYVAFGGVQRGA